ncbi:MAG: RimK family alpha-L-glutamate ligase [Clostridia bacterium]|nr:RimK family alpha-L-glutamate ligase [Clostridia bacterium]
MQGFLVVNAFFGLKKFDELYGLLQDAAKKQGISLKLVKTDELVVHAGCGFSGIELPRFAIFWDKDIYLAKMLENAGVRLFNSSDAIEICDNKAKTHIRLSEKNISVPETVIAPKTFEGLGYTNLSFLERAIDTLGLPLVIKEAYGSFGQQVYLAKTRAEAEKIVEKIGHKDFIMQKFVASSVGRDIRINVVGDKVVASMLRINENDFRSNISNGGTALSYNPTDAQKNMAIRASKAAGLDFAGVDVMFGENNEPIICEVNSNPHFKSTLDATGINLAEHIMEHIREEMK